MQFGEIEVEQILRNEFRIGYLEKIIEHIANNNPTLNAPSQSEMKEIKKNVIADLKEKYPNSGIEYTEDKDD